MKTSSQLALVFGFLLSFGEMKAQEPSVNDLASVFLVEVQKELVKMSQNVPALQGIGDAKIQGSFFGNQEAVARFLAYDKDLVTVDYLVKMDANGKVLKPIRANSSVTVPAKDGIKLVIGICERNQLPKIGTNRKVRLTLPDDKGNFVMLFYSVEMSPDNKGRDSMCHN